MRSNLARAIGRIGIAVTFGSAFLTAYAMAESGTFSVVIENDVFANTDEGYTNGMRFSWLSGPAGDTDWARRLARSLHLGGTQSAVRTSIELGQAMFTPGDLKRPIPDPLDRPYAGWLYGAFGLTAKSGPDLEQLVLSVGVVGPAAGGEHVQRSFHRATGANDPRGWNSQLGNEATLQLFYERYHRLTIARFGGFEIDAIPHFGGALGNVFVYANTGLTLRVGRNFGDGFGPPRVQPNLPGSDYFHANGGLGWYLFAGSDGRAVVRNVFLDGNTFRDSPSVDRTLLVGDVEAGLVLMWLRVRFALTHVWRTREFRTQPEPQRFGVVSMSVQF